MKRIVVAVSLMVVCLAASSGSDACTGIRLAAGDGSIVLARTFEWAAAPISLGYVIVPRRHFFQSSESDGQNGLIYRALYGYAGIYAQSESYIVEGVNESGLSAGMFSIPDTSETGTFHKDDASVTLCDLQLVSWVLSQFYLIDQMLDALEEVSILATDDDRTVFWRISEPGGRSVILRLEDGTPRCYENPSGLTEDSSGLQWLSDSPVCGTGDETVLQAFHILNGFDVPIGSCHHTSSVPEGLPSATQFTSATDQTALKLYYRTAWNSNIRCIALLDIDFRKVRYQSGPLDRVLLQPVEFLKVR